MKNSEHWLQRFEYREAGPQLILQAFLHRIVNGRGRVEHEYGLGHMRVDLLILWPLDPTVEGRSDWTRWNGPIQKALVACKIQHTGLEKTIEQGTETDRRLYGTQRCRRRTPGDFQPGKRGGLG